MDTIADQTLAAPKIEVKPEVKPQPAPSAMNLQHRSWRKWAIRIAMLVGVILIAAGSWWGWSATHPADDGTAGLITDTVKRGDLVETVAATGAIEAQTGAQVKIGSQITGRIKKLNADVGSELKAGAVIAELDLPDIQAQLDQAKANLAAARTKEAQQRSGVGMVQTQTNSAIVLADAARNSAAAKLNSAQATANLQYAQTPTDIQRAENGVAGAVAALSTAQSTLVQTQAGADLQIANTQQQINQAQATSKNSDLDLGRQSALLAKGFVAASIVDQAQAIASVNRSLILAAQQNLTLVQQKVTADLQSAHNLVTQSEQNVKTAQSALVAAQAESFLDAVKRADVGDARAFLNQSEATLTIAKGNSAQDLLKQQDVIQARDATRAAQQQVVYAQAQVDKTFIRTPISGTVLQLAAQQGETLAAGLSSPTLIVVADLNRLEVATYVDETDIGKIRIGQSATVTVDAFANQTFTGHVSKIASGSTIQQGVITYDVTISLANPTHTLKPDMTASVTIQTGKQTNVLLVSSDAVKIGTNGMTVNVLSQQNGHAGSTARAVVTGGTDGVNTEIKSGLKEGETVILAGTIKSIANPSAAKKTTSPFSTPARGGRGGGR